MSAKNTKRKHILPYLLALAVVLASVFIIFKPLLVTKNYTGNSFSLSYPKSWTLNDNLNSKFYQILISNLSVDPNSLSPEDNKIEETARIIVLKYDLNSIGGNLDSYIEGRKKLYTDNTQLLPLIKQNKEFKNNIEVTTLEIAFDYNKAKEVKDPTLNYGYRKIKFYKMENTIVEIDGFVYFTGHSYIQVKYYEVVINKILNSFIPK